MVLVRGAPANAYGARYLVAAHQQNAPAEDDGTPVVGRVDAEERCPGCAISPRSCVDSKKEANVKAVSMAMSMLPS